MLPRAGSASSSPTMRNVCARPSSRCTVTLAPKCTLLLSAAGSTTFALDRRAFQYRSSRWVAAIAVRSFLATAALFAASKRLSVRSIAARPSARMHRHRSIRQVVNLLLDFLNERAAHCPRLRSYVTIAGNMRITSARTTRSLVSWDSASTSRAIVASQPGPPPATL